MQIESSVIAEAEQAQQLIQRNAELAKAHANLSAELASANLTCQSAKLNAKTWEDKHATEKTLHA